MTESSQYSTRLGFASRIAEEAGQIGMSYFRNRASLTIESKGHQDMVSEADKNVELFLRAEIAKAFPDDGILGEEHGLEAGTSGLTWILDPIDGTTNFVNGIPAWSVVVACASEVDTLVGVIHDPCACETFAASLGGGALMNGNPMSCSRATRLSEGSLGVGLSNRVDWRPTVSLVHDLMAEGGLFFRNASGAVMLAYTAAGRLLGYVEEHMNAWDCAAGLLMVREAGGRIHQIPAGEMLQEGSMIITGGAAVFPAIDKLARAHFKPGGVPGLQVKS
jgi:myo-inositol-1(or 4)-monophosphatase